MLKKSSDYPSPCLLRKPSLSHVNGERDKDRCFLPFSPLAWEKGSGDEGFLNSRLSRPYIYLLVAGAY